MNKPSGRNAGGTQLLPGEERRRSQRVMVRIPVTLQVTIAAQKVTLQGFTVSVNDHGAMVECTRPIDAGTNVEIQNDRTGQKQLCRVTRSPIESQQSFLIPVGFVAAAPGFWHISFPPTDWKPFEE